LPALKSYYETPNLTFEKEYWRNGKKYICGIDEVGRGCWAGPLYVGAVVFPEDTRMISLVKDSKLLSPGRRSLLHPKIIERVLSWGIGTATVEEIDSLGLTRATNLAMERAVEKISLEPDFFLTDSVKFINHPYRSILKGDQIS
jgi:ribonuclease HII